MKKSAAVFHKVWIVNQSLENILGSGKSNRIIFFGVSIFSSHILPNPPTALRNNRQKFPLKSQCRWRCQLNTIATSHVNLGQFQVVRVTAHKHIPLYTLTAEMERSWTLATLNFVVSEISCQQFYSFEFDIAWQMFSTPSPNRFRAVCARCRSELPIAKAFYV